MTKSYDLDKVQYYDKFIRMASSDIERLFKAAAVWDTLQPYERFAMLESCGMLKMAIPHLQGARKEDALTQRQLRDLPVLESQYKDALGTLKILKERDQELYERERKGRENG